MKKFVIAIEESVVQEFEIIANDAEEALEIAEENYKNGKFVLEPGNVAFKQKCITQPKYETTEWIEF